MISIRPRELWEVSIECDVTEDLVYKKHYFCRNQAIADFNRKNRMCLKNESVGIKRIKTFN